MALNGGVPVVFLLGPGGAGKTTLGNRLTADRGYLHLDLDQYPKNGFDVEGLRAAWDDYWHRNRAGHLAEAVRERAAATARQGVVLSIPSVVMLDTGRIGAADRQGMQTVILYGSGAECLDAWLERERVAARGLDQKFWVDNNIRSYLLYSRKEYRPYRLSAFAGGKRRSGAELVSEIEKRLGTDPA